MNDTSPRKILHRQKMYIHYQRIHRSSEPIPPISTLQLNIWSSRVMGPWSSFGPQKSPKTHTCVCSLSFAPACATLLVSLLAFCLCIYLYHQLTDSEIIVQFPNLIGDHCPHVRVSFRVSMSPLWANWLWLPLT